MTGEVTLRGRVLPIGGLKEKTMAAFRNGIRTVIIPSENGKDLEEIDQTVRKALNFVQVDRADQVLEQALVTMPAPAETAVPAVDPVLNDGAVVKPPQAQRVSRLPQ
jgi:ATP-dependent Lon protease